MSSQTDQIIWGDGDVPVSTRFDDPFFSPEDGVAETLHVYLGGNDLPARFCKGFHIAELGFGTGLNALVAWDAWDRSGQSSPLHFTSFEAFPMAKGDMARAHRTFPSFDGKRDALLGAWPSEGAVMALQGLTLEVIEGDANLTLPAWQGSADAWFLDGFSPVKNPELWSPELMMQVGQHTNPNGTCATYTSAGYVRRGLVAAGFSALRAEGYGRKRHMIQGAQGA